MDRDLWGGAAQYRPRPGVGHKLDPYKGIIEARLEEYPRLSAKRLYDEVHAAGYTGGYGTCEGLRAGGAAAGAGGGTGAVRDTGGTARAGGLCDVHASLGPAACAGDGSEPLSALVAALLPPTDHDGADRRAGERGPEDAGRTRGRRRRPGPGRQRRGHRQRGLRAVVERPDRLAQQSPPPDRHALVTIAGREDPGAVRLCPVSSASRSRASTNSAS